MTNYGPFTLTPGLLAALQPHFEDQEGRESCIYPDGEGNPTTGIGHLLATYAEAMALPYRRPDKQPASPDEIKAAWIFVKATRRRVPTINLSDAEIDALFVADLTRFSGVLFRAFGTLVDIPQPAVLALYDMAFNLGGFYAFRRLRMAVLAEDWRLASEECHRLKIGERRNRVTRALFLKAAEPSLPQIQKA